MLVLNPCNATFGEGLPEDITLRLIGGCSGCELWLASGPVQVYRRSRLFDSERDKAICDAGGFFCQACLVSKPITEQSTNRRYCKSCWEYLTAERIASAGIRERSVDSRRHVEPCDKNKEVSEGVEDFCRTTSNGQGRGRAAKNLPLQVVKGLVEQGLSGREICHRLNADGIKVSERTIQRVIKRLQGDGVKA